MDKNYEIIDLDKEEIPEYCFKAIFLGDIGVGKTSIINYEINNEFDPNIESTTTLIYLSKNYKISDKKLRLQMWDLTGNLTYEIVANSLYRSALCMFIVFSLDDESSFLNLDKWMNNLKKPKDNESPIVVLIGNKKDNIAEKYFSEEEIEDFCKKNEIDNYFEVSAKNGENIHELFRDVVRRLYIKFIEPFLSETYSVKTFKTSSRNSEMNECGWNEGKCKVCDCLIY